MTKKAMHALCLTATLLAMTACIKRTERITVMEDGAVVLHTVIEGNDWDVSGPDAMPSVAGGWEVQEEVEVKDDGKKEVTLTATRNIAAGQPLPDSYAGPGSWLEDMVLQFPTTVQIEQRPDGTYYHFRRVYQRREHARTDYDRKVIMESDDIKALQQKEPEELTDEERLEMAEAFLEAHVRKIASFIDVVIEEFRDQVPQDVLLDMRQRALAVFDSEDLQQRIQRMVMDDDNKDGEEQEDSDDLEAELHEQLTTAVQGALIESGVPKRVVDAMIMAGMRAGKTYEITEDLGDEEWMVTVQLPGRIVAHNSFDPTLGGEIKNKTGVENPQAQSMDLMFSTADGQTFEFHNEPFQVGWRFKGKALYDRDVVLMATSVVPKE